MALSAKQTYLGDGVIATFADDYQIELRTNDGNNQVVYLNPSTYRSLTEFAEKCWPRDSSDAG